MTMHRFAPRSACNQLILALLLAAPALATGAQTAALVADLATGAERSDSEILRPTVLGNREIFTVHDFVLGSEAWVTDGTDAGTEMLLDACPGECSGFGGVLGTAHGLAFWVGEAETIEPFAEVEHRGVLVVSDATRRGTHRLGGPDGDLTISQGGAVMLGDAVLFHGCTPAAGCELWRSDGTEVGTVLVKDLVPGAADAALRFFVVAGSRLFFIGEEAGGLALYTSDGTISGTVRVESIGPGRVRNRPVAAGNRIFFARESPTTGVEEDIWTSDGTAGGTRPLADFVPQLTHASSGYAWFERAGDHVYFTAKDPVHGVELWKSDGTA
ncbi:MAG TPA: hypothetical protein VFS60_04855, partial [Thermoanaerobaculia bacterium]|nr:hypothetical protein [Thermoanaerobaculia bacterium]